MTAEVAHDDGIEPEQHANLLPGSKAVLPVKAGVRLFIAASGTWSPGSSVNVECRSRSGAVKFTLSADNSIAVVPAGTNSVLLTPMRVGRGFNLMARIFPAPAPQAGPISN